MGRQQSSNSDWSWIALRFGVYLFMKDRIGDGLSSILGREPGDIMGYRSLFSDFYAYILHLSYIRLRLCKGGAVERQSGKCRWLPGKRTDGPSRRFPGIRMDLVKCFTFAHSPQRQVDG